MIFYLLLGILVVGSAAAEIYYARSQSGSKKRYYRWAIYGSAIVFGALPAATGSWQWSLLYLPAALLVARLLIIRKT